MDRSLRIGVNLLWCRPGRVGGAEEYLVRQLSGLHAVSPEIDARLAVPPGFAEAHPELAHQYEVVTGSARTSGLPGRLLEEIRWLPAQFSDIDLVHHGNGTVPPGSPGPVVLTVHDLQYRHYPRYFSAARLHYLRWMIPRSVRRAAVVAVPSEFVRTSVIDAFDVDPDRVRVVPHGVPPSDSRSSDESELRVRYRLGARRVLVYPAATYPHKRHDFLLDLVAGQMAQEDIVLVFLGGEGRAERSISRAIRRRRLGDRVIRTGRVPDADRDGIIAMAETLVFPSEYEGFGAPVIEAMSLGTPVICSDRGALPEVAGEAAVIAPLDLDAWSSAIQQASDHRAELVVRGKAHAAQFTLEASGEALAGVYRLAAKDAS